jgi:stress-induced morphogen
MAFKAVPFTLIEGQLYRHGQYKRLKKCSTSYQIQMVLHEMHQGMGGGHFSVDIISKKNLNSNYWWLTVHKYVLQSFKKTFPNRLYIYDFGVTSV